jgi:lysophospholipase L1-like esterase
VAALDLRPALQAELRQGRGLYLEGGDGHPTAAGYRVIAAAVQTELARRGW